MICEIRAQKHARVVLPRTPLGPAVWDYMGTITMILLSTDQNIVRASTINGRTYTRLADNWWGFWPVHPVETFLVRRGQ